MKNKTITKGKLNHVLLEQPCTPDRVPEKDLTVQQIMSARLRLKSLAFQIYMYINPSTCSSVLSHTPAILYTVLSHTDFLHSNLSAISFASTHLYTWVVRGSVIVNKNILPNNTTNVPSQGLDPDCSILRQAY